jgi:hypothetical protein
MKFFLSFIVLVVVISCSESNEVVNKEQKKYNNKCKLEFVGIKQFPLDEESSYNLEYVSIIDDSTELFSFLNTYNNSIYLYDYKNSVFLRKIKYEKEGPNGVLNIQGYLYLNDDSIFVYSYNNKILYLTNSKAQVLEKFKLYESIDYDKTSIIYPAPFLRTVSPLKKLGNNVILFGFYAAEFDFETPSNRPVCVMVNLEDKSVKHLISVRPKTPFFSF